MFATADHHMRFILRARGFTLLELMVSVAIVGILAAIAIPSYTSYIIRGKRAAAQAEMLDIANREQQYFLSERSYADKAALEATGYALPGEIAQNYSYDITVTSTGAPTYTITLTPTGRQASDGALSLDSAGVKTPASKW